MPEIQVEEPKAETITETWTAPTRREYPHPINISPALHKRLIELGWTPPKEKPKKQA